MNRVWWTDAFTRRRLMIVMLIAVALSSLSLVAAQQGAAGAHGTAAAPAMEALKADVVIANRILFAEGFLDTSGHVSVRLDGDRFLMARSVAPELAVVADIMEHDFDGNVFDAENRQPYFERFIHGEIYRARPDVGAVVHGHTPSLAMFASSNIPLRPVYRNVAFIGHSVPVFKNGDAGSEVRSPELGRKLAETMGTGGAVLLHGHGVVVAARNLPVLIRRAVSLETNAQLVARLLAMGDNEPNYIRPSPGGGGARARGGAGGDNSKHWEAYKRRAEALKHQH